MDKYYFTSYGTIAFMILYKNLHYFKRNIDLRWSKKRLSTTGGPHLKKEKKIALFLI